MFIFRSSSGPHDPVQHHTHIQTHTLKDEPIHSHPHRVGSENLYALQHAWTNLHVPALSKLGVLLSPSACQPVLSVGPSSGTLRLRGGGGGLRCFSAGPTSQLPHCSSSPPSGKLIRSRVPGPSA